MSQYSIQTMVDPARNFGKVTVSAGYSSIDMVIVLNIGDGARLPQPSVDGEFNLTWWNSTDFLDPSDDPNREIVRATTRTEDILTVTRAQEGTSASNKNLPGKTYKMILAVTAKIIPDLQTDTQTRADTTVEVHRLTGIHALPQPSDNLGAMQRTLLQAIASTVQKLILSQKAAMDEATYDIVFKSGQNYIISLIASGDVSNVEVSTTSTTFVEAKAITATAARDGFSVDSHTDNANGMHLGYTINSNQVGNVVDMGLLINTTYAPTTKLISIAQNDVVRIWYYRVPNATAYIRNFKLGNNGVSGTIKSAAIAKDANIGLRYWSDIVANLVAGAAGSTIKIKILDGAGTALHTNFVTIAASEYARIPLERAVVLTATNAGQTVWNFASLSNADTFVNELGVLAKALLVELATDGTNYSKLDEISGTPASGQFNEDISNPKAPKITTNGTGVVSGTSKLRATYIVNIPLSNTTIKLQIQLNRLAGGDTSPSIQPFAGDDTKYVGAGQVAIV